MRSLSPESLSLPAGILAGVLAAAGASAPAQAEPRYGVCRQQIADYVTRTLGQTPTRIEVQSYAERMPVLGMFDAGSALVYVEECSGFHAFEVRGTETYCEHLPHYGSSSGSSIRYEGAYEDCRKG